MITTTYSKPAPLSHNYLSHDYLSLNYLSHNYLSHDYFLHSKAPDDPNILYHYGVLLEHTGHFDSAIGLSLFWPSCYYYIVPLFLYNLYSHLSVKVWFVSSYFHISHWDMNSIFQSLLIFYTIYLPSCKDTHSWINIFIHVQRFLNLPKKIVIVRILLSSLLFSHSEHFGDVWIV